MARGLQRSVGRRGAPLALIAAAGLILTSIPGIMPAASATAIRVPICGDPGRVATIPLGEGGGQRPDCPKGCHAMCTRRTILDDDE